MREGVQWLPTLVDKDAKRQQGGPADAVLAVDEDLTAVREHASHKRNALFKLIVADRLHVGRREVKKPDPGAHQKRIVVTLLGPQIYHGPDPVRSRKLRGALAREGATRRQIVSDPVEVRTPIIHIFFFIFFNSLMIFFIVVDDPGGFTVVHCSILLFQHSK